MIPAKPQNANPAGEWNQAKIMVYKGTVVHGQNGVNVLEYHLWTPKWTQMLQDSKFAEGGDFPYAFNLLNNMGGENHEGYIGLQAIRARTTTCCSRSRSRCATFCSPG